MSKNKKIVWFTVILLVAIHTMTPYLSTTLGSNLYNLYLRPIISIIIIIIIAILPKKKTGVSLKNSFYIGAAPIVMVVIYIGFYLALGALQGYGKNPFDTTPRGILVNIVMFFPYYAAIETMRARLLLTMRPPERTFLMQAAIAICFTYLYLNPSNFDVFVTGELKSVVEYIGSDVVATLAMSAFLTNIAQISGPITATITKIVYESVYFFIPVLPNVQWLTRTFVSVIFVFIATGIYIETWKNYEGLIKRQRFKVGLSSISTGLTFGLSILIIWFALGVFPVFPTLVLTGSMEPYFYPGDIVIIQRVPPEELQVGDVIQFRVEDYDVIHRIVSIEEHEITTKGDNNSVKDSDTVNTGFVRGKYIYHIPYIGKVPLYLKSQFNSSELDLVKQRYETGD